MSVMEFLNRENSFTVKLHTNNIFLTTKNRIAVTFPVKCRPGQSQDRTLDDEPLTRKALYNFPNR